MDTPVAGGHLEDLTMAYKRFVYVAEIANHAQPLAINARMTPVTGNHKKHIII